MRTIQNMGELLLFRCIGMNIQIFIVNITVIHGLYPYYFLLKNICECLESFWYEANYCPTRGYLRQDLRFRSYDESLNGIKKYYNRGENYAFTTISSVFVGSLLISSKILCLFASKRVVPGPSFIIQPFELLFSRRVHIFS